MTESQNTKCHAIIHTASASAAAVGALPIPGSDCVPLVAIQTTMIIALGEVFNIKFTKSYAESLAKTALAEQAGKYIAGQLLKLIPFAGSATNAAIAAAITEAIGWEIADDFDERSKYVA